MKKLGFTLAEVLITLGIIGVVAAMTIPNIMNAQRAIRLKSQFKKAHSVIAQSGKLMIEDGISLDFAPRQFVNTYIKYFKGATNCGLSGINCYGKYVNGDYPSYTQKQFSAVYARLNDGSILLQDGMLLLIKNQYPAGSTIWVSVDINGYKSPPNRTGYDLFVFQLMDTGEFLPMGASGTEYTDPKYCNPNKADPLNGLTCTQKAISNQNYFKDLTWKFK